MQNGEERALTMEEAEAVLRAPQKDSATSDPEEEQLAGAEEEEEEDGEGGLAAQRTTSRLELEDALEESSTQLEEAHEALLRVQQMADEMVDEADRTAAARELDLERQLEAAELAAQQAQQDLVGMRSVSLPHPLPSPTPPTAPPRVTPPPLLPPQRAVGPDAGGPWGARGGARRDQGRGGGLREGAPGGSVLGGRAGLGEQAGGGGRD